MIDLDLSLAPGCFGGPLLFKVDAKECKSCPFAAQCAPQAFERLVALRTRLGVKAPTERQIVQSRPAPSSAGPTGREMTLPKKVQELLATIERHNIRITESLARGENPFPATFKPRFMRLLCHVLLAVPSGVQRTRLEAGLATKLGWTPQTAASLTMQAIQALEAVGAAKLNNNTLTLVRS